MDRQLNANALTFSFGERHWSFDDALTETDGHGLLALHNGKVVHESYRQGVARDLRILFSVSMLETGILADVRT